MCLSPIPVRNRSKYFSLNTLHKVQLTAPCGQCAECLAAKQNEYYFRSYYQALETFDKGGYCLFDTLTYDDQFVPRINDYIEEPEFKFPEGLNFTCFRQEDIRLFFVRLRRQLTYYGFDVRNKLKYFVCSEYGVDPRYTHRPHYHLMMYVTDPHLDPVTLSRMIDKCWQKGRTDGEPYKGSKYVLKNRVFYKGADDLHMQNVSHYIGKYMTKDSEFVKVVNHRIGLLRKWITCKQNDMAYNVDFKSVKPLPYRMLSEENKVYFRSLRRQASQFIRSSQGFGLYMIDKLGKDWIFEHGCVRMPDKDNIWKDIPIPSYIMVKLFKEKKFDFEGKPYYGWSDYGRSFLDRHNDEMMVALKRKFNETFDISNMRQFGFTDDEIKEIYARIDCSMAGRSLDDLLFYQKYMKGRLYVPSELGDEPDYESFYYVSHREIVDQWLRYRQEYFDRFGKYPEFDSIISRDEFFESDDDVVYLQDNCVYRDKGFDDVIALYYKVRRRRSAGRQADFDRRREYESRMKALGYKVKVTY